MPLPRRLSSFHDYMGKLKGLMFSCEFDVNTSRVENKKIPLLTITKDQLLAQLNPTDNFRTTSKQHPDNSRTIVPDKEFHAPQLPQGIEPNQSACHSKYELSKQDNTNTSDVTAPLSTSNRSVEDQTADEWLEHLGDMNYEEYETDYYKSPHKIN